jgi:hypothetical protein
VLYSLDGRLRVGHDASMALPEFHGPKDYLDAARSPDASATDLDQLARSPFVFVDIAVAGHAATSSNTLAFLLTKASPDDWNGDELLRAIACNPNSSSELLSTISERVPSLLHHRDRRQGFAAGVALARRIDTPLEALASMLGDDRATTEFRRVVARESTRADVVALLRNDRSERVRSAANSNRYA